VLKFARPDDKVVPSKFFQPPLILGISDLIAFEFREPIGGARFGCVAVYATLVLMPKTAVDEDDLASSSEHQIRLTGEGFTVEPIPVSESMN